MSYSQAPNLRVLTAKARKSAATSRNSIEADKQREITNLQRDPRMSHRTDSRERERGNTTINALANQGRVVCSQKLREREREPSMLLLHHTYSLSAENFSEI